MRKRNKRSWRRLSFAVLAVALIFGPFQNCSVYQHSDRKFFEEAVNQSKLQKSVDCSPYLTDAQAQEAFADPRTIARFVQSDQTIAPCLVSVQSDSASGVDAATCTISGDNALQAKSRPAVEGEVVEVLDDQFPETGFTAYAYVRQSGAQTFVVAVGVRDAATNGVRCGISFNNVQDFSENSSKSKDRVFRLIHAINE